MTYDDRDDYDDEQYDDLPPLGEQAATLDELGLSVEEIATQLGVSIERVYQLLGGASVVTSDNG